MLYNLTRKALTRLTPKHKLERNSVFSPRSVTKMREPKWLIWLLLALIPICQPQEQSIQTQLNLLTKRTASLENEVKTLKEEVKTLKVNIS